MSNEQESAIFWFHKNFWHEQYILEKQFEHKTTTNAVLQLCNSVIHIKKFYWIKSRSSFVVKVVLSQYRYVIYIIEHGAIIGEFAISAAQRTCGALAHCLMTGSLRQLCQSHKPTEKSRGPGVEYVLKPRLGRSRRRWAGFSDRRHKRVSE